MERFIVSQEKNVWALLNKFKIQYGEIYSSAYNLETALNRGFKIQYGEIYSLME